MSLGSILVGLAVAVIVIAYIVRPFRTAGGGASSVPVSRTDKLIEAWVRATPTAAASMPSSVGESAPAPRAAAPTPIATTSAPVVVPLSPVSPSSGEVNFCPQCGRRVTAEYRFCPGCGALLPHEGDAA